MASPPRSIQPLSGPLRGSIRPPGSKSLTNRALLLAALAQGESTLANVLISYGLIFGRFGLPEMGAEGSGMGTAIAMLLGSALYFGITLHGGREHGFLRARPRAALQGDF